MLLEDGAKIIKSFGLAIFKFIAKHTQNLLKPLDKHFSKLFVNKLTKGKKSLKKLLKSGEALEEKPINDLPENVQKLLFTELKKNNVDFAIDKNSASIIFCTKDVVRVDMALKKYAKDKYTPEEKIEKALNELDKNSPLYAFAKSYNKKMREQERTEPIKHKEVGAR